MYKTELYHHGVKGMKWGHRKAKYVKKRATKRKNKYLSETQRKYDIHRGNAKHYSRMAKEYKKMSDKEYAKLYDDEGLLSSLGGAGKAANKEIMNIPVDKITLKKEYERIINKYLNETT